jgi:hypothetical protein
MPQNDVDEGQAPMPIPKPTDRPYWRFQCPACGEIHGREVKTYYEDDPESVLGDFPTGRLIIYHYFICPEKRLHFRVQPEYPFKVLLSWQYTPNPMPLRDVGGVFYFTGIKEE